MTVVGGKIIKIGVGAAPEVTTPEGIKHGDSEDRISRVYPGQVKIRHYDEGDNFNVVAYVPKGYTGPNKIVFLTDSSAKVRSISVAKFPEAKALERGDPSIGCRGG